MIGYYCVALYILLKQGLGKLLATEQAVLHVSFCFDSESKIFFPYLENTLWMIDPCTIKKYV